MKHEVVLSEFPDSEREWLADEFFTKAPTAHQLRYLAEHYEDIVAHNTVATEADRAEFARRAIFLRQIADELAAIAVGGGDGTDTPPLDPAQLN